MKIHLLFFVIAPFLCFSQNEHNGKMAEMPSTTDCPDWNDTKKPKGNADFYKMLRSRKRVIPKEEVSKVAPPEPISVSKTTGLPIYQPVAEPTLENPGIEISPISTKPAEKKENDMVVNQPSAKAEEKTKGKANQTAKMEKEEEAPSPKVEENQKKKREKKKRAPRTKRTKKFKKGKSTSCPNF